MKVRVPTVYVANSVVVEMIEESIAHPNTETGHSLVGIETDNEIFILSTIPDLQDPYRHPAQLRIGGQDQVEIFQWFRLHWDIYRKLAETPVDWKFGDEIPAGVVPEVFNRPLAYVGEWHKHPGDYRDLSGTDLATIRSILSDKEQDRAQILTPILVHKPLRKMVQRIEGDEHVIQQIAHGFVVNWYYTHESKPYNTVRVKPIIVSDVRLPSLPPLPWHIVHFHRMTAELNLLRQAGYLVRWRVKEVDGNPLVQEIVFGVDHPEWLQRLVIVTAWDYPRRRPDFQFLTKPNQQIEHGGDEDVKEENLVTDPRPGWFIRLWNRFSGKQTQQVPGLWDFTPNYGYRREVGDRYLIDYIIKLEQAGKLVRVKKQEVEVDKEEANTNVEQSPEVVGQEGGQEA